MVFACACARVAGGFDLHVSVVVVDFVGLGALRFFALHCFASCRVAWRGVAWRGVAWRALFVG